MWRSWLMGNWWLSERDLPSSKLNSESLQCYGEERRLTMKGEESDCFRSDLWLYVSIPCRVHKAASWWIVKAHGA
jgi:hypothetical protein